MAESTERRGKKNKSLSMTLISKLYRNCSKNRYIFQSRILFFSWTINILPETSYSVLMSISTKKKNYEWKKALFYFCWFDNIHHPGLYKSKNTFWIFGGKKVFFCLEIKKQYPDVGERLIARLLLQQIWTVRVSVVAGFH